MDLAPLLGVTPAEFCGDLCHWKTRVRGLLRVVVCIILRLAILVEHQFLTDSQSDRWTHGHSIFRTSVASRGKI